MLLRNGNSKLLETVSRIGAKNTHTCSQRSQKSICTCFSRQRERNPFHTIAGDETWTLYINAETQENSHGCSDIHTSDSPKLKIFQQIQFQTKSWQPYSETDSTLLIDFTTITTEVYCQTS
ncbi:hypothetical protein Trydic_g16348 [Trypoxylus dichotomus]